MASTFSRLAVFLLGVLPGVALSSPASQQLIDSGRTELAQQHFGAALKQFSAAAKADQRDIDAVYWQGVALNRLGRFKVAVPVLRHAIKKGCTQPDVDFELGWALLESGQDEAAIVQLRRYEAAHPGRGQTQEFLGRAYLATHHYEQAREALVLAEKRDKSLTPTVTLYRATLDYAEGKRAAGDSMTQRLLTDQQSNLGRELRQSVGATLVPAPAAKPLQLFGGVSGGYNSNAVGLGNTIPLPTDISHKGAYFDQLQLGIHDQWQAQANTWGLGYNFLLDNYKGLARADMVDHFVFGDFSRPLDADDVLVVRGDLERTDIGRQQFRKSWGLRPALAHRFSAEQETELAWSYTQSHYLTPVTFAPWNRDGHFNTLSLTHYITQGDYQAVLGYANTENTAVGSDFSYHENLLSATATGPLGGGFKGLAGCSLSADKYGNPNSINTVLRRDHVVNYQLRVSHSLAAQAELYVQLEALRDHSNVVLYAMRQNVTSAGLTARF